MSIQLDSVLRVNGAFVAALALRRIHSSYGRRALCVHGTKHPVAVLVRQNDVTTAFELDGTRIAPDDFERRYPGQRNAFHRLAGLTDD